MKSYPMQFSIHGTSTSGIQSIWTSSVEASPQHYLSEIKLAIPPEFDGPGGAFSPEDLYALALQNCFIATFKVFAEKSKLTFESIDTSSVLTVDRNEKGIPWMAKFNLKVNLRGVQQTENALRLLDKVSKSCMILNSVQTAKSFEFNVEPA